MAAVPSFTPRFRDALRLVRRPMIAFDVFAATGILAIVVTALSYSHSDRESWQVPLFFGAGLFGVPIGQLVSLFRLRVWAMTAAWLVWMFAFVLVGDSAHWGEEVMVPGVMISCGFFCGFLSLQHRWQLFAAFGPAVGWIGAVMVILNEEGRVTEWQRSKMSAWLPIPLALLAGFTLTWGFYVRPRPAHHRVLGPLRGGAPSRGLEAKKDKGTKLRRRNLAALLALLTALFAFTAVLSPYLWRTGRGDHESDHGAQGDDDDGPDGDDLGRMRDKGRDIGEAIERFARDSEEAAERLWPLLLFLLAGRPLRRWLVLRHLRRPFWAKSPSDRIDGLWSYVREGLTDAGKAPLPSDSVEEAVVRAERDAGKSPDLAAAASIYARARYGLGLAPGDVERARQHAERAFEQVRAGLGPWQRLRSWYRKVG